MSAQHTPGRLTAGRYRLTRDLPNPAVDRRRRSDWRQAMPVFQAGTEFHLNEYRGIGGDADVLAFEITLRKGRYTHQKLMCKPDGSEAWGTTDKLCKLAAALVPLLERVDGETEIETKARRQALELAEARALNAEMLECLRNLTQSVRHRKGFELAVADCDAVIAKAGGAS